MNTPAAPNKQAQQSLDEQLVTVPADVRQHAITSPVYEGLPPTKPGVTPIGI